MYFLVIQKMLTNRHLIPQAEIILRAHGGVAIAAIANTKISAINQVNAVGNRINRINNDGATTIDETANMIVEEFNETKPYAAGNYVRKAVITENNNNATATVKLYVFKINHAANTPWNSSEVTEVKIADEISNLKNTVKTQQIENEIAAVEIKSDHQERAIKSLDSRLNQLSKNVTDEHDRIATKAEAVDLAITDIALDKIERHVTAMQENLTKNNDQLEKKAEAVDLAEVETQMENVQLNITNIQHVLTSKAEVNTLAGVEVQIEVTQKGIADIKHALTGKANVIDLAEIETLIDRKANKTETSEAIQCGGKANEVAAALIETDFQSRIIDQNQMAIGGLRVDIANLSSEIDGKVSKPSTQGASGQVLSSDGGGRDGVGRTECSDR